MRTPCPEKDLPSSVDNCNKFKRIFTIFGTLYPDDTFYFAFKIYLSLCSFDVIKLSKITFSQEGDI